MEFAFRFIGKWQPIIESLRRGDELIVDTVSGRAWFRRPSKIVSARIWTRRPGGEFARHFQVDVARAASACILEDLDRELGGVIFRQGRLRWEEVDHRTDFRRIFRVV